MLLAQIIIPLAIPNTLSWKIPEAMADDIKIGCRVEVNLGKSKRYSGVVKNIYQEENKQFKLKEIIQLIDSKPIVTQMQLRLWQWMAAYYMCSEGEVMAAALPAHLKLGSETLLLYNEAFGDDFSMLNDNEYLVAEALLLKHQISLLDAKKILDIKNAYPVISRLIDAGVCFIQESLQKKYKPRFETYVSLQPEFATDAAIEKLLNEDEKLARAEKQMSLLLCYLHLKQTVGSVSKADLLQKSSASDAQLNGLVKKGILGVEKVAVGRIKYLPKLSEIKFELSPAQSNCFESIKTALSQKNICLLHGITSSGKTEIYIKLIEEYLKQGRQVFYMLPEIALTTQIIRRLQAHFGGNVGVYHSQFSPNERVEVWNKVQENSLPIILGPRSALFLPYANLGLIICDEEHDTSYKQQEPAPRYHARDTAIYYALANNAKILLGSATPSYESYFNAQNGKYGFVEITERYGNISLPQINIVDTKAEAKKLKEKVLLSSSLAHAIDGALQAGQQIILFQNRRGYSPYLACSVCNHIPQCSQCDVSLTYHKYADKLICHYCGTVQQVLKICPSCGGHPFVQKNYGTEKIEETIAEKFPKASVMRMDIDSIKGKNTLDTLIAAFEKKQANILVGTQMVVKGFDFDGVELVGVLDADGLMHFADFRVNERAFQMLEQVGGRAGRKSGRGQVIVQTTKPNSKVLESLQQHDYKQLYQYEIDKRRQFFYPPFSRIIKIVLKHKDRNIVQAAAYHFAEGLKKDFEKNILGPTEPPVARVRNNYLMEILIKLPKQMEHLQYAKQKILFHIAHLHSNNAYKNVAAIPDVDTL